MFLTRFTIPDESSFSSKLPLKRSFNKLEGSSKFNSLGSISSAVSLARSPVTPLNNSGAAKPLSSFSSSSLLLSISALFVYLPVKLSTVFRSVFVSSSILSLSELMFLSSFSILLMSLSL